ncbi:MAG: cobalamin B12-binding domain-containing protein [Candidatus Micrarchaeaceae archaeon]
MATENVKTGERRIKVLLAKPAIDGHDRGIYVIAKSLRDAGMEVLYMGLLTTPEQVVDAAIQEDVDVIGLSLLNNAYMEAFGRVAKLLKDRGAKDIAVVGGGIILPEDKPKLEAMGITGNFGPGTPMSVIIDHIRKRGEEAVRLKNMARS